MRFQPNDDQAAFLSVLDGMAASPEAGWKASPVWARFDWSARLDARLEENGFYDCAAEETLGPVAAAAMTHRLARLPVAVECGASALLRTRWIPDMPRPLAVIEDEFGSVRFLPVAKSVLRLGQDRVEAALLRPEAVDPVESLFAYPMGRLKPGALDWETVEAHPETVRNAWRVAVAAELGGVLKGALEAVVTHVRDRRQFGRPIGSFQAVQHRLAGIAVAVEAAYWLTLRAAQGLDPADPAICCAYVQGASTRAIYDLHQFMGAMGLTLEHPLHRWTYRARLLRSSLGGATASAAAAAARRWPGTATT